MRIHVLSDTTRLHKMSFNEFSKLGILFKDPTFRKIMNADAFKRDSNSKLLVTINGNPHIKKKYKYNKEDVRRIFDQFDPKEVYLIVQDMHPWSFEWEIFYNEFKDCNIITTYKNYKGNEYDVTKHGALFWVPHHMNTDQYRDWGKAKTKDVLLFGVCSEGHYPERVKVAQYLKKKLGRGFQQLRHPGYNLMHNWHTSKLSGLINTHRMCVTTASRYDYLVAKYFEVIMSKTVPVGITCQDADEIGMKVLPYENYKDWQDYPLEEQYKYIRDNFNLNMLVKRMKDIILENKQPEYN
jgi:hypothetical protein